MLLPESPRILLLVFLPTHQVIPLLRHRATLLRVLRRHLPLTVPRCHRRTLRLTRLLRFLLILLPIPQRTHLRMLRHRLPRTLQATRPPLRRVTRLPILLLIFQVILPV